MPKTGVPAYLDDDPLISFDDDDPPQYTAQIDRSKTPYNPATGENYGDNPALRDLIERPKPGIRSAKLFDDAPWKLGQPIDPAKVMQPLSSDSQSGAQGVPYYLDKPSTPIGTGTPLQDRLIPGLSMIPEDQRAVDGAEKPTEQPSGVADYGDNPDDEGASVHAMDAPAPVQKPPVPPSSPSADPSKYYTAADAYKTAVLAAPKLTAPKPWQRIVSGAIGGLAGWSNAASRTRTPIDIGAVSEGILHPGYQEKLEAYKAGVAPLKAAAEIEGEKYAAQQKATMDAATMLHLKQQGDYYEGLGRTQVPVTPELEKLTGGVLKAGSMAPASIVSDVIKDAAGRYERRQQNQQNLIRIDSQDIANELGKKVGDFVPATTYNSVLTRPKPTAPEPAALAKQNFQRTVSKLAGEGAPVTALSDVKVLAAAIRNSRSLSPQEKNDAFGYLAANTTPAATGTTATIRMEGYGSSREYPVINKESGQLEMRSASEINAKPGAFAPAGAGATAMSKEAIFNDLNYNIDTARKAIDGLGTIDSQTRAALAYVLRHTDPASAMQSFLTSTVAANLSPAQQEAVQSLGLLAENAMTLRTVAGMGAGSDAVRAAILATIPGPNTPSAAYARGQLNKLQQVVDRLHTGVPGMGNRNQQPNGNSQPPPPVSAPPIGRLKEGHDTSFANGQTWRLINGVAHQVVNGKVQ